MEEKESREGGEDKWERRKIEKQEGGKWKEIERYMKGGIGMG